MNVKKAVLLALSTLALSMPAWADDANVAAQLRTIQAKQDEILSRLADIKTELDVVRVRSTQ